ncbi:MAG TPA: hypothetical protein VD866_02615 [Urbifossiella sp.]|nr:hypothetical protein [Urbifossiella sp.]
MSRRWRAAVVLVVLLAAGVGGGWLIYVIRVGQERARPMNALRGIHLQLALYADLYQGLPPPTITDPDGRPLYSWRFGIVAGNLNDPVHAGFYGQRSHHDKPWDSPENRRYHSEPYSDLPGGPADQIDATRPGSKARFVAVVGPGTVFGGAKRAKIDGRPNDALLLVETTGCPVHWMQPGGDVDVRTVPRQIGVAGGIGPAADGGREFYVVFADGSIRLLRSDVPFENLAKFFSVPVPGLRDRDTDLGPYTVESWPGRW